jgi:hypothetical protein
MGLVGPHFVGGAVALGFLLFAEIVAATAAVSEAALIYVARHRNLMISTAMILTQAALSVALIVTFRSLDLRETAQAAGPAIALCVALGLASIAKARLLSRLLAAPVSGWRWALVWAAAAAAVVGYLATLIPEWAELIFGIPLILTTFAVVVWRRGFTHEDRVLFRRHPDEGVTLPPPQGSLPGQ